MVQDGKADLEEAFDNGTDPSSPSWYQRRGGKNLLRWYTGAKNALAEALFVGKNFLLDSFA